jgi:hypothetical protein
MADVEHFTPYGDLTRGFQTPPPSARYLRLVRRMAIVRDRSIGGAEHHYLVAVIDISQFPPTADATTLALHIANLVADVLRRMGIKRMSQNQVGSAAVLAVAAKDIARVTAWATAHAEWCGVSPVYLGPIAPRLAEMANIGLEQAKSATR